VTSKHLYRRGSLLSIMQVPRCLPPATFVTGEAGAANAALFAVTMLAAEKEVPARRLWGFRDEQSAEIRAVTLPPMAVTG
jgi:5-(carboxyamino)imidazole ribonucleotide mutase